MQHARSRLYYIWLIVFLASLANGQVTVLRHVTVIDGNDGALRRDVALVIEGEKIGGITAVLPRF